MNIGLHASAETGLHVFPPAIVPVLRSRATTRALLADVPDEVLTRLLTTIFWAGLETYEGERYAIGVTFLGTSRLDFIIPEATESRAAPLYQWRIQRFETPRPFAVEELVKLAVVGVDRRIYSAVNVLPDGSLVIAGLAREGFSVDPDPFVKIIATRPGCLAVRRGRDLLLAYERGAILEGREDVVFCTGPVRLALEAAARFAELDEDVVPDYVETARSLVREMASHGRGGILIVSAEAQPYIAQSAPYKMALDFSVASLLKLARRLGRPKSGVQDSEAAGDISFGSLLRNAFLTETERFVEEIGVLTAIDGAVLLNRHLSLVAFGVTLPVGQPTALAEATDAEGRHSRAIDLGSRGTRHRAGASYAAQHPGSVVFVASEDGHVSCLFRETSREETLLWRLGPAEVHPR